MSELFSQLGIDWKLLLAQGVNFVILLVVLTKFVYKPLMKMVEARRQKIELGIRGGEMAEKIIKTAEEEKAGIINCELSVALGAAANSVFLILKVCAQLATESAKHCLIGSHLILPARVVLICLQGVVCWDLNHYHAVR